MNGRYPIGVFDFNDEITVDVIENWINEIERLPGLLTNAVNGLNED